ncbi:flagellar basal body-associated FliL family protein [Campylobacter lari]|uniref:flagellar basal body-associated FliL family protein n=1 Tax=Campylobacter lari TaxID=201 RepID=UPI0011EB76B2|nr:flagellar basal body-associated FliL family protein [Campylobacter lari]EAI7261932.1 flagellar basal body-associated FliL family protein [Campylobacter lari]EAJ1276921.1 flagellar basal body-associated FliL family protein [Campylobacter lari]EAJ5683487.1 flagellar basal body-associated FliL family protein [Campylobacter lari]EFO9190255.1 flagellar basal body-associated FliL family protein [Campylobacter lari]EJB6607484.1 flagellar basal body-associated FliL family protein [Campylobacter lar
MRWVVILFFSFCSIYANSLSIEDFRTDLYSKAGNNTLKKIEMTLDFEGENLEQKKIIDALNTIVSSYFYEDLFTEVGKNNFKETLLKFSNKKYKTQIKNIYILKINSVAQFDIEELKRFVKDLEKKEEDLKETAKQEEIQNIIQVAKTSDQNNTQPKDINATQTNSIKDSNISFNQDVNTSKEAMDMILKTMENAQMQMLAPSKEQDLFKEIPF